MSENQTEAVAIKPKRKMPWWGWAGWAVIALQLFAQAAAFDGTSGLKLATQGYVVGAIALAAGIGGIVVAIVRSARA